MGASEFPSTAPSSFPKGGEQRKTTRINIGFLFTQGLILFFELHYQRIFSINKLFQSPLQGI